MLPEFIVHGLPKNPWIVKLYETLPVENWQAKGTGADFFFFKGNRAITLRLLILGWQELQRK